MEPMCAGPLNSAPLGSFFPEGPNPKAREFPLADVMGKQTRPKVIYLVGQTPFLERPDCDYVISQDTYYPPFPIDAFLPAASFAESEAP